MDKTWLLNSAYWRSFHSPRNWKRFWREPCEIPRVKDRRGSRMIRQPNPEEDIAQGYRLRGRGTDIRRVRLDKLTDNKIYHHFRLSDKAQNKYWFFTSYDDAAFVSFIRFDIDRHSVSPEIEASFWNQFRTINNMADDLECQILWTTSPGDVFDGRHVQGLYAWIKLDGPVCIEDLHTYMPKLAHEYSIDCEYTWHRRSEPYSGAIRYPGQRYVELACVDIDNEIFYPIPPDTKGNVNLNRLALVVAKWETLEPLSIEKLASVGPPVKLVSSPLSNTYMRRSGQVDDQGNTFTCICQWSGRLVRWNHGDWSCQMDIEDKVCAAVREQHADGNTCSVPGLLESKVHQVVERHLLTYDPAQAGSYVNRQDHRNVSKLFEVDLADLEKILKALGVSDQTREFMAALVPVLKAQNGRIAAYRRKVSPSSSPSPPPNTYMRRSGTTLSELAGSRWKWQYKIHPEIIRFGLLEIAQHHDKDRHICRQWTLGEGLLEMLSITGTEKQLTG